jgi:hypothetical protein
MRRVIAAASFLAVLLPVSANALVPASRGGTTRDTKTIAIERLAMRRWPAQQRAAIRKFALVVASDSATGSRGIGPDTFLINPPLLTPVGNLVGDDRPVVLDTRQSTYSSTAPGTLGVTARDGRTGRPLWHEVLSEPPADFIGITAEPLGPKGAPGLLAVDDYQTTSGQIVSQSLRIRALSGRTGKVLWTRAFTGAYGALGAQTSIPGFDGALHDAAGPDEDVLVSLETSLPSPNGFQTTPEIVSGVDGATHQPGNSFTSTEDYPSFMPLPDVSGDGLADMLVLVPGSPGLIQAERGHEGGRIWSSTAMPITFDTGAVVLGRFTHRAYPDIAIESAGGPSLTLLFTVLDGRTGHKVWSRTASQVIVLGRAGRHLVPAVELTTDEFPVTSPTTITDEIEYEAIGVANKVIYRRRLSVSIPNTSGGGTESDVGTSAFGDVEPDGSAETLVNLSLTVTGSTNDVTKALTGYIDGRTGAFRPVSFDLGTDGSLRHGHGTDLLATDTTKNLVRLTARNGVSRRRYYQRNVAGLHGTFQHLTVQGLRVSGHNCSDLALTTVLGTDGVEGVLSARGAWLWSVRFPANQMTGGTLRHYKSPKSYCV